jgi:hypothetical protein
MSTLGWRSVFAGAAGRDALAQPIAIAGRTTAVNWLFKSHPYNEWYGTIRGARVEESRDGYVRLLATPWWTEHDAEIARRRANLFAGRYFCVPAWHGDYALYDDANQDAIWWDLRDFVDGNATQIAAEIDLFSEWMNSDARYLDIHKLRRAADYRAPRAREVVASDPRQRQMRGTAGGRGA